MCLSSGFCSPLRFRKGDTLVGTLAGRQYQEPGPDHANRCGRVSTSESHGNGGNVTRARAADDFRMIGPRMEELRRERVRPRAADDFALIQARLEELRREHAQILAETRDRSMMSARP